MKGAIQDTDSPIIRTFSDEKIHCKKDLGMSECELLTGSGLDSSIMGYRENRVVPDLGWTGALE